MCGPPPAACSPAADSSPRHDSCRTLRSAHLVHARSCQTASGAVRRRNADRSACAGHASPPPRQGVLAPPDDEACRGFVRRRPVRCRATSDRPLVPLRASGQEAEPERQPLPGFCPRIAERRATGQARTVRASATRPAPVPALQPLGHRTVFQALALLAAFRRRPTGLHACPELAYPVPDRSSAPSGFRLGTQRQSVQTMALCVRLSVRRGTTPPNGVPYSAWQPRYTTRRTGSVRLALRTDGSCLA